MVRRKFDESTLADLLRKKDHDAITKMAGTAWYQPPDSTNLAAKRLEKIFGLNNSVVCAKGNSIIVDWARIKEHYKRWGCLPAEEIEALHDLGLLVRDDAVGYYGVFDGEKNLGPWYLDICYPEFFARKKDAQAYAKEMYSGRIGGGVYVTRIEPPSTDVWYLHNNGEDEKCKL